MGYRQEIQTSLSERMRLVKIFKEHCISARLDFMPSTLLGWMDAMGYLNTDRIKSDLAKEKDELNEMEESQNYGL